MLTSSASASALNETLGRLILALQGFVFKLPLNP